jgi:hypothetical protein
VKNNECRESGVQKTYCHNKDNVNFLFTGGQIEKYFFNDTGVYAGVLFDGFVRRRKRRR